MAAERDIGAKDIGSMVSGIILGSMDTVLAGTARGALEEDLASLAKAGEAFVVGGVGRCGCLALAICAT